VTIDALLARRRIAPYVLETPLVRSDWLSDLAEAAVFLKLESLQHTHSFKVRGAFNAVIARLERASGQHPSRLVTASAGNHGRALALAAETFRLPLVVFAPSNAPRTKVEAIGRHGAELDGSARDYDEAERLAKAYARETGAEFISPYNDPDVIAGAGTIALEVFQQSAGAVDAFVVPIGGGGLISGIAATTKPIDPTCQIVGVEVEASCPFHTSVRAGRLVEIVPGATLADGLAGNPDPETITFDYIRRLVDEIVMVSEADLRAGIRGLLEHDHLVSEGAGATGVAAVIAHRAHRGRRVRLKGRRVVIVMTGSNIDLAVLDQLVSSQ
jgi:threonine dehydratase